MKRKKSLTFFIVYLLCATCICVLIVGVGLNSFLKAYPHMVEFGDWKALTPIGSTEVRALMAIDENTIMAGLLPAHGKDGGLVLSTDSGKTWLRDEVIPATNQVTSILRPSPESPVLYISLFDNGKNGRGGIYTSIDLGNNWARVGDFQPVRDVRSLVFIPGSPDILLAGTVINGIFASADNGFTWEKRNYGLGSLKIQHIAVSLPSPDLVFAATIVGLFRSTDRARTWNLCRLSGLAKPVMCLQVITHPDDASIVYALERPPGMKTLIWQSLDTGITWRQCGWEGLPGEFHPRWLVIDPASPDTLYIGTVIDGVYRSDDRGASWSSMNKGIPISEVTIITHVLAFLKGDEMTLLAGTDNDGTIYATPLRMSLLQKLAMFMRWH